MRPALSRSSTLCISLVLLFAVTEGRSATLGSRQKDYRDDLETVWAAAIGALQGRGDPIIYSDKGTGIITSDFKIETDDEWRHKFNLLISRTGDNTRVSITCIVENRRQSHKFSATPGLTWEAASSDGTRETQLLDAVSRRLQPGGAAADLADADCHANFAVRGSVVRGTTYSTSADFMGLDPGTAINAALSAISSQSLTVVSTDKQAGTISAQDQSPAGKNHISDFSVSPITGGVRISITQKLRAGDRGHDGEALDQFCKTIAAISALTVPAVAPPSARPTVPSVAAPGSDSSSIEDRLRKLDDLLKKGLITEEEYKKKRAELLSKL